MSDRETVLRELETALREMTGVSALLSNAVAGRVGIGATDLEALDLLVQEGAMTAGRLAERTGLSTGAVTGLVDRLEDRGFAHRAPDPADRRKVVVVPDVARAEAEIAPHYAGLGETMAAHLLAYDDTELAAFTHFMRASSQTAREHVARLRDDESGSRGVGKSGRTRAGR